MKKEVRNYLSIGFLVLAVLILAYLLNLGITGFVVFFGGGELISPQNDTNYTNATQLVNISIKEGIGVLYNWNGTNVSYTGPDYIEFNEGLNTLTIWANDSGNISSVSVTFTINTTEPEEVSITIDSPSEGETYDTTEIDLRVMSNEEFNASSWWYVLSGGENVTFEPNITLTSLEDGSYSLIVYANDTEGNVSSEGVSFLVSLPSCSNDLGLCTEEECTDADGYWYDANEDGNSTCNVDGCATNDDCDSDYECSDGSCVKIEEDEESEPIEPSPPPISFTSSEILPLSLNPGSSQESSVIVTNTGEIPLSSCMLKLMGGEFDSWISISEEIININPNEERGFSFSVAAPEETEENSYSLKVATLCSNMYKIHDFVVNVEKKKLEFEVISADRTRSNRVRIIYSLEELAGEDQDVVFTFSLVDANNIEVGRIEVNQSIDANSTDEFRTNININESLLPINETTNETLESELTLNVNFNSQIYSSSIQEKVLIGAPIGGFAIFEGVGAGEAIIFVIVLFVLVFIFVFARRMRRKGKTLKDLFKGKGPEPA